MRRVLIVDDDPSIHLILTAALEGTGRVQITFAHDGEQALEQVRRVRPDLILLDVMMPGIKGDDVMYEIRKDPALRDMPVVFVTGKDNAAGLDYERYGARGLIEKPFDPSQLAQQIAAYLPPEEAGRGAAAAGPDPDVRAAEERQRTRFLERGQMQVAQLRRQIGRRFDLDAARRVAGLWLDRGDAFAYPLITESAARVLELLAGGTPAERDLLPVLDAAERAFETTRRDEKWRRLDEEIATAPDDAGSLPAPEGMALDAA